jgi:hypothetical protein
MARRAAAPAARDSIRAARVRRRATRVHPVKALPQVPDLPLPAPRATATASRPATSRQTVPAVRIPPPLCLYEPL